MPWQAPHFRLAHRARPIRQCQADATSSGLLPPAPPDQAALSFTRLRQQGDGGFSNLFETAAHRGALTVRTYGDTRLP